MTGSRKACVGLLHEEAAGRELAGRLEAEGYDVFPVEPGAAAEMMMAANAMDAWLFDARLGEYVDALLATDRFILPLDNTPALGTGAEIHDWCEGLVRQLRDAVPPVFAAG